MLVIECYHLGLGVLGALRGNLTRRCGPAYRTTGAPHAVFRVGAAALDTLTAAVHAQLVRHRPQRSLQAAYLDLSALGMIRNHAGDMYYGMRIPPAALVATGVSLHDAMLALQYNRPVQSVISPREPDQPNWRLSVRALWTSLYYRACPASPWPEARLRTIAPLRNAMLLAARNETVSDLACGALGRPMHAI